MCLTILQCDSLATSFEECAQLCLTLNSWSIATRSVNLSSNAPGVFAMFISLS